MIANNILRSAARCLSGVGLAFALALTPVLAQTGASTGLTGRVTDPTGALIPGATVTLTRVDTGEQRIITTNSSGDWEARFLSPGIYRLQFEGKGFKKLMRDGVAVTTAEMATVNVGLEVGTVDQTVSELSSLSLPQVLMRLD
jgi:Carboxypeptidase regulatory-like domain